MSLYRIWWGTSNNRSEFAHIKANDIDKVIDFVKSEFLEPDTEFYSEDGDSEHLYLMIDLCKDCDKEELRRLNDIESDYDLCESCEMSEYIEILEDNDTEEDFKTIMGTNEFYDLTNPEQTQKALNWSNFLTEAWETSPQLGVSALIVQTIRDNPDLEKGFSRELIEKSKKDLKLI